MKRWKKVVIWVVSILMAITIGGVIIANYAVNKVLKSLTVEQSVSTADEQAEENTMKENDILPQGVTKSNEVISTPTNEPEEKSDSPKQNGSNVGSKITKPTNNEKPGLNHDSSIINKNEAYEYTPDITAEKAKKIEKNVTVAEKAEVTSILLKELSIADIKKIQGLASGGLTQEEKKEARRILIESMSSEQYNELSQIAKKYGMSEGRSYDEIKSEENKGQQ
ncbi:hypothetical protein BCM02_104341 [Paenibacillus methanolicus]|uniref:Uncharacterized protein n=2 Tax=Paenibacillus methanolicus TaxID=582686 RepID=A0A5S5CBE1_9BACL|nr:hypothetical protein BCM02_104341 [Paenibacillus methanolicus]